MKISKTLKDIIETHYKIKSNDIRDKYHKIIEDETKKVRDEIQSDEMYKTIIELNDKLRDKYIDTQHVTIRCNREFFKQEPIHLVVSGVRVVDYEDYLKEIVEVDSEKQKLLLTLEYEKDLSELNSILENFGVKI